MDCLTGEGAEFPKKQAKAPEDVPDTCQPEVEWAASNRSTYKRRVETPSESAGRFMFLATSALYENRNVAEMQHLVENLNRGKDNAQGEERLVGRNQFAINDFARELLQISDTDKTKPKVSIEFDRDGNIMNIELRRRPANSDIEDLTYQRILKPLGFKDFTVLFFDH